MWPQALLIPFSTSICRPARSWPLQCDDYFLTADDRFPPDPRKRQQYCGNLVLKINAKLGGQHSLLASVGGAPKLFPHENNPFMIIGADVTHPMGFNRSTPSIASVVGSIDRYATRYAERSRLQGHRVEMIQVSITLISHKCNLAFFVKGCWVHCCVQSRHLYACMLCSFVTQCGIQVVDSS